MIKLLLTLISFALLLIPFLKPGNVHAVDYNLTGQWNWTDYTTYQSFSGVADIVHEGDTFSFTWRWRTYWVGAGSTSGSDLTLVASYTASYLTAQWFGTITDNGNRIQGTWRQNDSQTGTFVATKIGPLSSPFPSPTPLPSPSPSPTVPYFSQLDPAWGQQEYDHANSLDLDCGTTMAQCGCATTSAAMLLKYYGVNRAPDGSPTTPETLNNWLKENNGYSFGNVRWPSIASYSLRVNNAFGTQKIKFVSFGPRNDFETLNSELNNDRPVILQESFLNNTHFILATGKAGETYYINDPNDQSKIDLSAYSNSFQGMRLYERTNTDLSTIYITTPAPTEVFIIDSLGRRIGKDSSTGIIYNEIPNSFYFIEPNLTDDTSETVQASTGGVTTLAIINPSLGDYQINTSGFSGNYDISFAGYDKDGNISKTDFTGASDEFKLNFSPTSGSEISVAQIVEVDIKPGSNTNAINPANKGEIPVGILTTGEFDATTIDPLSIRFGPNQAAGTKDNGQIADVDNDGDLDLMLHFKTQDIGIKNTDTLICLDGITLDDVQILGCDKVKVLQ